MHHRAPRRARLGLGLALTLGVTVLVVGGPVVSLPGDRTAPVALDSMVVRPVEVPSPSPSPAAPTTSAPATPSTEAPPPTPEAAPATTAEPAEAPAPTVEAPPAPPVAPASPGPEGQVLALVNAERAAAGCAPLAADEQLAAVARAHSADMRDRGFFDHVNPDGLDPFARADRAGIRALAENIARGQADASAVMAGWMASTGHRANILDCRLTRLGVGVADGPGGPWWTQLFG